MLTQTETLKGSNCRETRGKQAGRRRSRKMGLLDGEDKDAFRSAIPSSLKPVGRLDLETEGLMLLTDSGPLKRLLELPRFQVPRTYVVYCHGARLNHSWLSSLGRPGGFSVPGLRKKLQPVDIKVLSEGVSALNAFLIFQDTRLITRILRCLSFVTLLQYCREVNAGKSVCLP